MLVPLGAKVTILWSMLPTYNNSCNCTKGFSGEKERLIVIGSQEYATMTTNTQEGASSTKNSQVQNHRDIGQDDQHKGKRQEDHRRNNHPQAHEAAVKK